MPPPPSAPAHPDQPTQVRHPWRATARTTLLAGAGLLPLLPDIARELNMSAVPAVAAVLAVTAGLQRVLALPAVESWLKTWMPKMAAEPRHQPRHRK